jgi:hypothetical protein
VKYVRRAVLAVGVVGLVAGLAGCSDSTHGSSGTLTLTEPGGKTGSFGLIGKPSRKGFSPGDGFAFSSPLQDTSKKVVGELNAVCISTQPSPSEGINGTCSGTATVPGGSFALNVGGKEIGGEVSGSIVGGAGKYEGAYGVFKSVEHGSGENAPSTLTFEYTLP